MRNLILSLALTAILGMSVTASAQSKYSSSSYGSSSSGQHSFSGAFGFYSPGSYNVCDNVNGNLACSSSAVSGFFGIGGDYEYQMASDFTVGGLFRYYSTSESISNTTEDKVSAFHLGGMAKAYMHTENFAPYIGAGLGLIQSGLKRSTNGNTTSYEPSMHIGFSMAVGVLYKINSQFGLGVENLRVWALGEKINGQPISDYMIKGKFSL